MTLWSDIEPNLTKVHAPIQYVGGEWNAVTKDWNAARVRVAIGFPDCYKIGMSHLGMQIFYSMINEREDALCERFFTPWPDMARVMEDKGIPLFTVDSHRPVKDFDLVGFSLQTELGYTNVIKMLMQSGIPLYAKDRGDDDPIIVGGGPNASHPEPIADFFDVFQHGDGEEAMQKMIDILKDMKGRDRDEILRTFEREVPGVYVPKFFTFTFGADNRITSVTPDTVIKKAVVDSLPDTFYPVKPIVPYTEVVFDRINLEIMRGCPHRCRFCQAVNLKNKLRIRTVEQLVKQAEETYKNTGHEEISLISLSSGDHPKIQELLARLNARFKGKGINIAMPSLRLDSKLAELPRMLATGRRGGFTVAPEGGTEALRKIIRKPIKDVDLFATARAVFEEGWTHMKLYFMIGLPGETPADFDGIVDTAKKVSSIGKEVRGKLSDVNVTISPLIPKPHTPFQFVGQKPIEETLEIQDRLRKRARGSRVHLKGHDPKASFVEAVLARGDRRMSKVLVKAVEAGCGFDEWREYFDYDRWMKVFEETGLDAKFYANREIGENEITPWDHIDSGIKKWYLYRELQHCRDAAKERREAEETPYAQEAR